MKIPILSSNDDTPTHDKPPLNWKIRDGEFSLFQPKIMGILNITPDSFSDGGRYLHAGRALERAFQMVEEGADLLDVGGESTRPGASPVGIEEEWGRISPVLKNLLPKISLPVSIDTRHGEVARRALLEGAAVINDISGGRDPKLLETVAREKAGYVLMHLRGNPATMMRKAKYQNVVLEVKRELEVSRNLALEAGIDSSYICLDPGFGFAKTPAQNYLLLEGLEELSDMGHPLMVGLSRKRMLQEIVGGEEETLKAASVVGALIALTKGAHLFRVHDIRETWSVLKTFQELSNGVRNSEGL